MSAGRRNGVTTRIRSARSTMTDPTADEAATGHRRFAVDCNNRAWRLAEVASRTAAEDATFHRIPPPHGGAATDTGSGAASLWWYGGAGLAAAVAVAGGIWWAERASELDDCVSPDPGKMCLNPDDIESERDMAIGVTLVSAGAAITLGILGLVSEPAEDVRAQTSRWACLPGPASVSCALMF